ncbi:MAG: alpha/beta hydrolase [Anaerolineae bacterium]|nr:alpha/beta hydrolase [Anaerolineae bacterium]
MPNTAHQTPIPVYFEGYEQIVRQTAVAAHLTHMINDYSGWHFVHSNPEQGIEPPTTQRLHELQMPVLVIAGEWDTPDFLQITAVLGQQIPQAQTDVVPGVGHMVNMGAPVVCNRLLAEFLSQL